MVDLYLDTDQLNDMRADTMQAQAAADAESIKADAMDAGVQADLNSDHAADQIEMQSHTAVLQSMANMRDDWATQTNTGVDNTAPTPPEPAAGSTANPPVQGAAASPRPLPTAPSPAASTAPPASARPHTTAEISGGGAFRGFDTNATNLIAWAGDVTRQQYGDDAAKAVQSVLATEGGLNGARGDNGQSAGPLQFYAGGELSAFARDKGLSLEDAKTYVETHQQEAVQWALNGYLGNALQAGLQKGLSGADLATYIQANGQRSVSPERAGQWYNTLFSGGQDPFSKPITGGQAGMTASSGSQPYANQFQLGLSTADAYAACGPAAAIAFAQRYGRNPTAAEAMNMARQVGWNNQTGMAGVQSEKQLLDFIGVPAQLDTNVDWGKVQQEAQGGNPVIVSTPGHYFFIDGVQTNPDGGAVTFHVGGSGTALKQGAEWMSADQMQNLMGKATGILYADSPLAPAPSVASGPAPNAPVTAALVPPPSMQPQQPDTGIMPRLDPNSPIAQQAAGNPQNPFAVKNQATEGLATTLTGGQSVPVATGALSAALDPANIPGGIANELTRVGLSVAGKVAGPALRAGLDAVLNVADRVAPPAAAFAATTGKDILNSALDALKGYPEEQRAAIEQWADDAIQQGHPPSTVGATVQRWMQENPLEATGGTAETAEIPTPAAPAEATAPATGAPEAAPAPEAPQPTASVASEPAGGAPAPVTPEPAPAAPPTTSEGVAGAPPPIEPGAPPEAIPEEPSRPNPATLVLSGLNETKRSIYALSNVHAANMTKALATSDYGGPSASLQFLKDYATSTVRRVAGQPDAIAAAADTSPEAAQWMTRAANAGANWLSGANPDVGTQLVGQVAGRAIGGATTGAATAAATYNATQGDPDQGLKTFMAGATGAVLGATLGPAMHDALFKDAIPRAATALFRAAVEGGTPDKEAATYVNNLFGMNNLEKILGSRPMADLARLGLQAPSWLFSEARLANSAIVGGAKTAIPGVAPTANQALSRDWWIKTLLTYGAITEAVQYALTRHFTNENSQGSEFQVEVPTGQNAPNGAPANISFGLFPGQAQQVLDAAARTANNPASGAAETAADRVNRLLVTAYDELANEQYYNFQKWHPGPPIVKPDEKVFGKMRLGDSTEQGIAKRAEFAGSQFAPISASGSEREAQYGAPLPLVAAATLLGQQMSENSRPQRVAINAQPTQGAPPPLPTRAAPTPTLTRQQQVDARRRVVTPIPTPAR